jgi:hypothetical protein
VTIILTSDIADSFRGPTRIFFGTPLEKTYLTYRAKPSESYFIGDHLIDCDVPVTWNKKENCWAISLTIEKVCIVLLLSANEVLIPW